MKVWVDQMVNKQSGLIINVLDAGEMGRKEDLSYFDNPTDQL